MAEVELSVLLANQDDQRALKRAQNEFTRLQMGDATHLFTIGMEHMGLEQLDKAHEYFLRALDVDPAMQQAYNNLGVVEERRGNFDLARERYETARAVDPSDTRTIQNLHGLLAAHFDHRSALSLLREHVRAYPTDEPIRLQIADSLLGGGQISEGFKVLQSGLELDSGSAPLNFQIGVVHSETGDLAADQHHLNIAAQIRILQLINEQSGRTRFTLWHC